MFRHGPKTAAGRNSSAPTSKMVPNSTKPNVTVSVRNVPTVNGSRLLRRQAAGQRHRGDDRDETAEEHHQSGRDVPVRTVQGRRRRRCAARSLKPQVSPSPSNPEPLLADAELNS